MKTRVKKHYRIREGSPIYWAGVILLATAVFVAMGLMNSWELGLL